MNELSVCTIESVEEENVSLKAEITHLRSRLSRVHALEQKVQRLGASFDALYETTLTLMQQPDASHVLHSLLARAGRLADTPHGYIALTQNGSSSTVKVTQRMGLFVNFVDVTIHAGEGLTGQVLESGEPLLVNDYSTWPHRLPIFIEHGVQALVGVPLLAGFDVVGVLGMAYDQPGRHFDQDVVELLERFAPLATLALENARLYNAMQQELEDRRQAEAVIEAQTQTLLKLSAPLLPLANGVVVLPLIGSIDSTRAQQIMQTLLEGVATHHANVAILDVTGVAIMDTQVANVLVQAAQAVKLLGAQVILTGMQPAIAQTLVQLGVEMRDIMTRSTLQAGIASALQAGQA